MKTCPNCQNPVNDGELFCPNCGTKVDAQQTPNVSAQQPSFNQSYEQPNNNQQQYNQQNYNQQQYNQQNYNQQYNQYGQQNYYAPQNPNLNTTPILIWSIINILLCCMPLGIWALVLCLNVNKKPTYEEAEKALKTAKTVSLIGTIGGFVFQIFYIIILAIAGSGY